jgi:hypothetical protein
MKEHFCPAEQSMIAFEKECNWCGELESQEPVAWMYEDDYQRMLTSETFCTVYSVKVGSPDKGVTDVPLYTTPPQRTWVGLSKEEVDSWELPDTPTVAEFAWFIEAKLKEKNT